MQLTSILANAVSHCQEKGSTLAVLFLDLDGFKNVNDKYGHHIGDELLIKVANRLKKELRSTDSLARIGGDEFVAVLNNIKDLKECEKTLSRLVNLIAEPFLIDGSTLKLSASIGATLYPHDISCEEQLIRHADHAMYQAKQSGKNSFKIFDAAQASQIIKQNTFTQQIQSALKNDEFILHYQPKVNMESGEVIGVEALIRWQHPELGLLLPGQFLPLIENTAIAVDIDDWVINAALKQISNWQASDLEIPVSINISAAKLQQDDFTLQLKALLSKYPGFSPKLLQLEVLESTGLSDLSCVSSVMSECGISFALDDFGTGYSSLTYLRQLPAELIKIDQSFVREMLKHQDDYLIVKSVIGLAQSFDRQVIAEGVESIEHGVALLKLGCTLAQGYSIAKPMEASKLSDWIRNWQPYDEWKTISRK